jgi:peptide/nickel transport system substrate-binding protein
MMRRRRVASPPLAGALAAISLLASLACSAPGRRADVVVFASGADLESANPLVTIHPLARQVQRYMLFVTLARYDASLAPVPYAATAWSWSPDRRALSLRLAGGLRWHDGVPTTAHDAVFTIDAARDPATGYPRAADLAGIAAVTAPDDSSLVVRFRDPQPTFPLVLCELPILPRHLLDSVPRDRMRRAPFNEAPVGNGPYRFVRRDAGQRWIFERNDAFPAALGGPPALARLVIAVVDEATTKFAGLVGGELDLAGIAPASAPLVRHDPALRVVDFPVLLPNGIVFNTRRPPFDDGRVRRAVSLALDRHRIIDVALNGFGAPAGGPVPPDHPYAAPAGVVRDTAAADSLLDAAGWRRDASGTRSRGGAPLAFELLTVGSADNAVEQLIQADLAARGIRMEIRQQEMSSFLATARSGDKRFDALLTGIPGDLSLAYLSSMYASSLSGSALDYGTFHTPALDSLLAAARAATPDVAAARWLAVQELLDRAMPVAWVYHSRGVLGVRRRLSGVTMDLRGELVSVTRWQMNDGRRVAGSP